MSGFGVVAWILMGSAVGWVLSRLMLGSEDDALRGTAAGMIGATLGGVSIRLLESAAPGVSQLNGTVAALAGSLWLTWIACVVTSGGQRGEVRTAPQVASARSDSAVRLDRAREMSTYAAARDTLVDQLLRDAMAHDAERYDEVGRRFDTVERGLPRGAAPELARLRVALTFWDAWIDARNRDWQLDGGIAKAEWPFLARSVAADLEGDRDVTNARVVTRFDAAAPYSPPGNRVQALAARLRAG
jgi:uncharacterized membrane protein YeaQ/YmgE (transglycosylase-associated protein family)